MIFPKLEHEPDVQVSDRTRLSAVKSFVTVGSPAITTATIKPSQSDSAISIFNTDQNKWFLDWQYGFICDITALNNKIDFKDNDTTLVATIADGSYTGSQLATAIQTALNAAGGVNTYTVTFTQKEKFLFESTGRFSLILRGNNEEVSFLKYLPIIDNYDTVSNLTNLTRYETDVVESLPVIATLTLSDGTSTQVFNSIIRVFSKEGDSLYSSDSDLQRHENKILNFVEPGRNTFLNIHRRAQHLILAYLDRNGYVDDYGNPYTKKSVLRLEELHEWSIFLTLKLIFESLSNATDDIFREKAKRYEEMEKYYRDRIILRLDTNNDDRLDLNEGINVGFSQVFRR